MLKREDFIIKNCGDKCYAYIKSTDNYLLKPGRVVNWLAYGKEYGYDKANKNGWFSSREELEKCLDTYLENQIRKGQEMDLNERLIQCRKDKEAIATEEKNILEEINKFLYKDVRPVRIYKRKGDIFPFGIAMQTQYIKCVHNDAEDVPLEGYKAVLLEKEEVVLLIKNLKEMIGE